MAGQTQTAWRRRALAAAIVAVAVGLAVYAARRGTAHPTSDDATIDADVVHIAPVVGGRIVQLAVSENARVARGELLFQIDPQPYQWVLAQAQADLQIAEAALETQRRAVATQRSVAKIADDQSRNARANYQLTARTTERLRPLNAKGYVATQQLDQAEVAEHDAATALRQAQEQASATQYAVDTVAAATALVAARQAALAIAQRALDDTRVLAPHDGYVVGLNVVSGEVVVPNQSLFTLIDTDEWYAVANVRETRLPAIAIGDCATVYSLIDRRQALQGVVQGIGWGVLDEGRINLPRSVPYVERSLNWVRVEQRFPVRIRLAPTAPQVLRLGASAVVEIKHGAACR